MKGLRKKPVGLFAVCALAVLSACSGSGQETASTPAPAASIANPISFPLYHDSHVVAAKAYTQSANSANVATSATTLAEGAGTYSGHEVIAATPASFDALTAWLHTLDAKPPEGYTLAPVTSLNQARTQAKSFGLDFTAFQTQENGKKVGLLVVVMDPTRVTTRLGPVLDLIGKYRMLPGAMRASIDSRVQSRIGMSVTQAMQPDSPIGAAMAALDQFQHSNSRGILLIDAAKK